MKLMRHVTIWGAAMTLALTACGDGASSPAASPTAASAVGAYELDGAQGVLLLQDGGSFCLSQDGFKVEGRFEVEGAEIVLAPSPDVLPPETGTIDGDVITDPDGDRWVRTDGSPACEGEGVPEHPPALPREDSISTDPTIVGLEEAVLATELPATFDGAAELVRSMPTQLDGATSPGPVESSDDVPTISLTYGADPSKPFADLDVLVFAVAPGVSAGEMVDATAHLAIGYEAQTSLVDADESRPRVIGKVSFLEGVGRIPKDERGYLAAWAPSADAEVIYVIIGATSERLIGGVEALAQGA